LIDGKVISRKVLEELAVDVKAFSARHRPPHLVVIIVGEDPASQVYVRSKVKKAKKCGIISTLIELAADTPREKLLSRVEALNTDKEVDGILVQLPLPDHIDQQEVIERISPDKDVDGFHPYNLGRLASGHPVFVPCTPLGISVLLERYGVETQGVHAVIVGRSVIVGKPMALLLAQKARGGNATVTLCHSRTKDLEAIIGKADILIAAIGSPEMIHGDMIKKGAVVIDVGMNRVDDPGSDRGYRLTGDVHFESARKKASLITPVPGGVGLMTVAMLLHNTLLAARRSLGADDE
jgi:methylenetetrahydrofolate dehydrogenase (NADP+)/methenyltetrahydrofolate cyclohydrolase